MATRSLLVLAALALGSLACVQNDGTRNPLSKMAKVSVDEERARGAAVDLQLQAALPLIDDPVVLGFVNDLGQSMVRKIEPQPFIYRFRLVVDPQLNAFALPGGYIYFHTGTLMAAASVDELAGVMAHEIAHVKARHYARLVEQALIPDLLAKIAGIAASVATGEAAPLLVSEGVNVALQLRFTREFETEADDLGSTFMARAGYEPIGMARFFQRIVASQELETGRLRVPPYLYSHPDVEQRIEGAMERAERLTVTGSADPELAAGFLAARFRLTLLLQSGRTTLRAVAQRPDRSLTDPLLADAEALVRAGDAAGALARLEEAEHLEPNDPRVPFRRGELLAEGRRTREAIAAWRRALLLDPGVALNYYRIGMAYKSLGDRVNATFYLEQALRRFEPGGALQRRVAEEIDRLTFPVVAAAGIADGSSSPGSDTIAGHSREEFRRGEPRAVWWAQVTGRYVARREEIEVRWTDPSGQVVQEAPAQEARRPHVTSTLALAGDRAARVGIWRVEALLDGDVIDRRTFRLAP